MYEYIIWKPTTAMLFKDTGSSPLSSSMRTLYWSKIQHIFNTIVILPSLQLKKIQIMESIMEILVKISKSLKIFHYGGHLKNLKKCRIQPPARVNFWNILVNHSLLLFFKMSGQKFGFPGEKNMAYILHECCLNSSGIGALETWTVIPVAK